MAANIVLKLAIDTDLGGATDEFFTDPVTDGARGIVQLFGAALPGQGIVELHWGDPVGGWTLIRAVAGGTYEYPRIYDEFLGDGVKMFRVTRTKIGGGGPLAIKSWFKAVENN
jgi:hypothetical protein